MANINNLSDELIERARSCKSRDELAALAKSEGVELTDEQLESFSGGAQWDPSQNCKRDRGCDEWVCPTEI